MASKKENTTLCLIDAQNIYYTPKRIYGTSVDFKKLYQKLTQKAGGPIYPIIYTVADPVVDQTAFIKMLTRLGYHTRIKLLWHEKGEYHNTNWDDDMIKDAALLMPYHKGLIMVSGDHGFIPTLDKWAAAGRKTQAMAFERDLSTKIVNSPHLTHVLTQEALCSHRACRA